MILEFSIPLAADLFGSSSAEDMRATYTYKRLKCEVYFEGEKVESFKHKGIKASIPIRKSERLHFIIEDCLGKSILQPLLEDRDKTPLLSLLVSVINEFVRVARCFGRVPFLRELIVKDTKNVNVAFRHWDAKAGETMGTATALYIQDELPSMIKGLFDYITPRFEFQLQGKLTFSAMYWGDVVTGFEEAEENYPIWNNLLTNSEEHLVQGNYRLATLEAVVALEIIVSRFLTEYLLNIKKLSKEVVNSFLTKSVGLSDKVAVLLEMTTNLNDFDRVDTHKVDKAIKWRNDIMHRTGELREKDPEVISDVLDHVKGLIIYLGTRLETVAIAPEIDKVIEKIRQQYSVPVPKVFRMNRIYTVHFRYFQGDDYKYPDTKQMEEIIRLLNTCIKAFDTGFDFQQSLHCAFSDMTKMKRIQWEAGQYRQVEYERYNFEPSSTVDNCYILNTQLKPMKKT